MQQLNDLILKDYSKGERRGVKVGERGMRGGRAVEMSSMLHAGAALFGESVGNEAGTMQDGGGEVMGGASWRRPRHARTI